MPRPLAVTDPTITSIPVDGSGTITVIAAVPGKVHRITSAFLIISVDGTMQFHDGTAAVSGVMDIQAKGGFVLPAAGGVYAECNAANRPLQIITSQHIAGTIRVQTGP